jgi:hypothetical protein
MRFKTLLVALFLASTSSLALALTPAQIVEISNQAQYYMEQSAAAADRGDEYGACTNAKKGISLFYQITWNDVPADAIDSFFIADTAVKELVGVYLEVCSKH